MPILNYFEDFCLCPSRLPPVLDRLEIDHGKKIKQAYLKVTGKYLNKDRFVYL
jgi:hypothetical protein